MHDLHAPPMEDVSRSALAARRSSTPRMAKPPNRVLKPRNNSQSHSRSHSNSLSSVPLSPHHEQVPLSPQVPGMERHKRVWKACERCRMKKTKCDGEFPCKRCKDDGLVCTAGIRKKTEYKQIPRGYAEVLENTQFVLIATVHKLYTMVRSGQQWDLGEPDLNERGQPIIHNIATRLGCMRPNADADLPPHTVFPEDEAGLSTLATELEQQQRERELERERERELRQAPDPDNEDRKPVYLGRERASSTELDHADMEHALMTERGPNLQQQQQQQPQQPPQPPQQPHHHHQHHQHPQQQHQPILSPQSFSSFSDFDGSPLPDPTTPTLFPAQSPAPVSFPPPSSHSSRSSCSGSPWIMAAQQSPHGAPPMVVSPQQNQYLPHPHTTDMALAEMMLNQGLIDSDYPDLLPCATTPNVMMGLGDPMMYSGGYYMETPRL